MMTVEDFNFELPPELIAQFPAAERSASRLLVPGRAGEGAGVHGKAHGMRDLGFRDLPSLLRRGDLLVFNQTRVVKARLFGTKASGGNIELLIERVLNENTALAHIRASHAPKAGSTIHVAGVTALVRERRDALYLLEFDGETVFALMERAGALPLPPYIEHAADAVDDTRYQTVYAKTPGAVAAPTAGLHFDVPMLDALAALGVETAFLTLHVGAGTFQPVRVNKIAEHVMHSEWYEIVPETAAQINQARAAGRRVIAVGTTSLRALESAALRAADGGAVALHSADGEPVALHPTDGEPVALHPAHGEAAAVRTDQKGATVLRAASGSTVAAGAAETAIFITPGFEFKAVDALITNFHLPKSTLMMLVSAFAGHNLIRRAYAHAIAQRYRFFSYGDAMFLTRELP